MSKSDRRKARSVGLRRERYLKLKLGPKTVRSLRNVQPSDDEKGTRVQLGDIQKILHPDGWLCGNMIDRAMNFLNKEHPLHYHNDEDIPEDIWRAEALGTDWFWNIEEQNVTWPWMTEWMNQQGLIQGKKPQLDYVIIPWHYGDHWTLTLVFPLHHKIVILDSYERIASSERRDTVYKLVCEWLHTHMNDDFQEREWDSIDLQCPQQENGNDCGVHLVMNAWCLSKGIWPMAHKKLTPEDRRSKVAFMVHWGTKDCPIGIE